MKLGKTKKESPIGNVLGKGKPARNQNKKNGVIIGIMGATALMIVFVYSMGKKAENTVTVAMLSQNVYKNQVITESMLEPYEMLEGEFEKFALVDSNGTKKRRVILWDERGLILNSFAAYPLKANTYAEYRDFVKSRIDNSDNVLYSYPGKEIVPLEIEGNELQAFKTFLQPGDKLNIEAVFTQRETVVEDDGYGGQSRQQVEVVRTENLFTDIMIADLLNSKGDSILDIYADYKEKTVWQQNALDNSQEFADSVVPKTLLVALTPEEKDRYYYYLSKQAVEFKASMPQRVD